MLSLMIHGIMKIAIIDIMCRKKNTYNCRPYLIDNNSKGMVSL